MADALDAAAVPAAGRNAMRPRPALSPGEVRSELLAIRALLLL